MVLAAALWWRQRKRRYPEISDVGRIAHERPDLRPSHSRIPEHEAAGSTYPPPLRNPDLL
jgi:hypothetical protein